MSDMNNHRNRTTRSAKNKMKSLDIGSSDDNNITKCRRKRFHPSSLSLLISSNDKRKVFIGIIGTFVLYHVYQTFADVKLAQIYKASVEIKHDYSNVKDLNDLRRRSALIKDRCYVSDV